MNKQNKLFLTIFIVLIVVIGGEFIYYYSLQKPLTESSIKTKQTNPIFNKSPSSIAKKSNIERITTALSKLNIAEVDFITNMVIMTAKKDTTYNSSVLTNEVAGALVQIDHKPGQIDRLNSYQELLLLQIEGRTTPLRIIYSKEELSSIVIMQEKAKNKTKIGFADLKAGDKLTIQEKFDMKHFTPLSTTIIKQN